MSDQRPIVIGIAGKAGAGKDTFAQYLYEALLASVYPKGLSRFNLVKFADPLKEIVGILTGDRGDTQQSKDELLSDWVLRFMAGPTIRNPYRRQILQWLGTDVIRAAYENAWVDCYARELQGFEPTDVVFTTDVRFQNEVVYINSMERSYLIRVVRPGAEGAGNHDSETAIDHIPMDTVLNDGSLDALRAKARAYAFYLTELYGWKR